MGELFEELEDDEETIDVIDPDRSCMNCKKRNVCTIFQQASFLHPERWEGPDDPPIQQDRLAVMCDEFEEVDSDTDKE